MNRIMQLTPPVVAAMALLFAGVPTNADGPETAANIVKVTVEADKPDTDGKQTITIKLTLKKPWRVLANPVGSKELAGGETKVSIAGKSKPEVVKIDYPQGKLVNLRGTGDFRVYDDKTEIKAYIRRAKGDTEKLEVRIYCVPENYKKGICLLPATLKAAVP